MSDFEDNTINTMVEAHRDGIKNFIKWCEENWKHDTREQWKNAEPYPSEDYVKGWNAAIEGIMTAFGCYSDEFMY